MKTYELNLDHKALNLKRFRLRDGTLSACDSDLRDHPYDGTVPYLSRLYNDACDVGIAIRSHITGKIERFVWNEHKGQNGDYSGGYEARYFLPTDRNSMVKEVVIFND